MKTAGLLLLLSLSPIAVAQTLPQPKPGSPGGSCPPAATFCLERSRTQFTLADICISAGSVLGLGLGVFISYKYFRRPDARFLWYRPAENLEEYLSHPSFQFYWLKYFRGGVVCALISFSGAMLGTLIALMIGALPEPGAPICRLIAFSSC
jgi:hypothetical protein